MTVSGYDKALFLSLPLPGTMNQGPTTAQCEVCRLCNTAVLPTQNVFDYMRLFQFSALPIVHYSALTQKEKECKRGCTSARWCLNKSETHYIHVQRPWNLSKTKPYPTWSPPNYISLLPPTWSPQLHLPTTSQAPGCHCVTDLPFTDA